jgi:hypothetical protein
VKYRQSQYKNSRILIQKNINFFSIGSELVRVRVRKECIGHKTCALFFSTTFVQNIFRCGKYSGAYGRSVHRRDQVTDFGKKKKTGIIKCHENNFSNYLVVTWTGRQRR